MVTHTIAKILYIMEPIAWQNLKRLSGSEDTFTRKKTLFDLDIDQLWYEINILIYFFSKEKKGIIML